MLTTTSKWAVLIFQVPAEYFSTRVPFWRQNGNFTRYGNLTGVPGACTTHSFSKKRQCRRVCAPTPQVHSWVMFRRNACINVTDRHVLAHSWNVALNGGLLKSRIHKQIRTHKFMWRNTILQDDWWSMIVCNSTDELMGNGKSHRTVYPRKSLLHQVPQPARLILVFRSQGSCYFEGKGRNWRETSRMLLIHGYLFWKLVTKCERWRSSALTMCALLWIS